MPQCLETNQDARNHQYLPTDEKSFYKNILPVKIRYFRILSSVKNCQSISSISMFCRTKFIHHSKGKKYHFHERRGSNVTLWLEQVEVIDSNWIRGEGEMSGQQGSNDHSAMGQTRCSVFGQKYFGGCIDLHIRMSVTKIK